MVLLKIYQIHNDKFFLELSNMYIRLKLFAKICRVFRGLVENEQASFGARLVHFLSARLCLLPVVIIICVRPLEHHQCWGGFFL